MNYVVKAFMDKETGKVYYIGDAYEGDRADELIELGYVQGEKAKRKTKKTTK